MMRKNVLFSVAVLEPGAAFLEVALELKFF